MSDNVGLKEVIEELELLRLDLQVVSKVAGADSELAAARAKRKLNGIKRQEALKLIKMSLGMQ